MTDDQMLKNCEIEGTWWRFLTEPHPYEFALLVIAGSSSNLYVHYYLGISVVYTHFYYLIIVIAGLWYGRRAIWIALFFGGLHIAVTDLITGCNLSRCPGPGPHVLHRGIRCRDGCRTAPLLP